MILLPLSLPEAVAQMELAASAGSATITPGRRLYAL